MASPKAAHCSKDITNYNCECSDPKTHEDVCGKKTSCPGDAQPEEGGHAEIHDLLIGHMARQSPWREHLPDGCLGPQYGPRSKGERDRHRALYGDTREAGSLWDWEQVPEKYRPRMTWESKGSYTGDRYDFGPMNDYVKCASAAISFKQLQVWSLHYRDGYSLNRTAREMEISFETAKYHLRELRRGLREWISRRSPPGEDVG